jgi:aryl-alcohol dehydrogenase-like predicted oxidoreductase
LEVLTAAAEAGLTFIDTADIYSRWADGNPGGVAETIVGKWLKKRVVDRSEIVLATKVRGEMGKGPNAKGLSRQHVLAAAEASLRRLGVETIDLYQLHWPDDETPIEETLRALDDLVRRGSVRYIGCSNFAAWQLVQALWTSDRLGLERFVSVQPHYSLMNRAEFERELEEACRAYGLGVLPYSPLGGGFLTGKYRRGETPPSPSRGEKSNRIQGYMKEERNWSLLETLERVAAARGKTVSQVALGWLLTRPEVTSPIIGPRSVEQLQDNLGAVGLRLNPEEMKEIEAPSAWE